MAAVLPEPQVLPEPRVLPAAAAGQQVPQARPVRKDTPAQLGLQEIWELPGSLVLQALQV